MKRKDRKRGLNETADPASHAASPLLVSPPSMTTRLHEISAVVGTISPVCGGGMYSCHARP